MLSYLIDMYAKSRCVETAKRLFDIYECGERDQVTWNAMIAAYMHDEDRENSMLLFRKMLVENHLPNEVTISLILPACNTLGGIQVGKQIQAFAIRQILDTHVFVGTALVDMYAKCGAIELAEKVFDRMTEKNRVTYTTMILGFGQHGLGDRALSLFKTMQSIGIKPDGVTFVALLSACSHSGLVEEGLAVYKLMQEVGIVAMPEHYCCVVDLLGRAGRVEEAYEFLKDLGDNGNHVGIWGCLLAACKLHGMHELGKCISRRLFDLKQQNGNDSTGYCILMSNVLASMGKWDGVHLVRQAMKAKGLIKEPGVSWIYLHDKSHRFLSKDARHPESELIHAMVHGLALEMKPSDDSLDSFHLIYETSDLD
ncbi:hypothetical protein HPP92_013211 [Vanilla planifolia]|uniref:Pentatricopeptide repeat-containing protein n=1 Tax=Vanilla planifolia TaxID=51239 RepID=A0A835UY93_VANPL|nr:hypothetical protein HPP92_013211 [Vanilla planifolia]